ncbi:MAG TPA: tetratricopeptide repeat protein [Bryobacteraceae bacterium]|nr:tetratricopeptide repeat protein [Bryobacteraceae bacterium]
MLYRVFAATLFAAITLSAQGRGSTGGSSSTGGSTGAGAGTSTGGNIGRPSSPSGTTGSLPTSTYPGDAPRPILITGKIMLDDGTPPPNGILIERVCAGGRPRPEGYTDSKGHFTFTLGQEMGVMADASEASNRNEATGANPMGGVRESQLAGCELRAVFAGFRSNVISLAGKQYMGDADVGTIILHRMNNVEGLTISATSALAPKDARKAYERGLDALKKSKTDDAQKEFEKAVDGYPKYASAWYELGRIYERRDHIDQAREAYNHALAADSKYVNPYERLYMLAGTEKKWQEVADTTDKVLRLNPYDFPAAYYFNGVANLQLNKLDVAEKSAREAVKLDTKHENPRSNYILGIILAQKQDLTGAADCLRAYLKDVPNGKDSDLVRRQLADIDKVAQAKQN